MLTPEEKERYLEDASHCPKCASTDVEGGSMEMDGRMAWQRVTCLDCGAWWEDIYTLTGVEDVP